MPDVAVLGAGAWGTALANLAARSNRRVTLWTRDASHAREMRTAGSNERRLPGIALASGVFPTSDMDTLQTARLVLLAVPTQACRSVVTQLAPLVRPGVPVVICAKGLERETGLFPSDIVRQLLPANPVAIISGPSFAADVAQILPTAVTLASLGGLVNGHVQAVLSAPWFRLYHSSDMRGVELGGAAKNVMAIACGMAAGRALGASAGAALIARGFAEMARLGRDFGVMPETLMGLSGLGDLVLTCQSRQSRNFSFGFALGAGEPLAAKGVVEGAFTAGILARLAREREVDMPIVFAVEAILAGKQDIYTAIGALLQRPSRAEAD